MTNKETVELVLKSPEIKDAEKIHRLICQNKPLDPNSVYLYLLMSSYFTETCAVIQIGDELIGALTGFIAPQKPNTFFIWQIAVEKQYRGKGLALIMADYLLNKDFCKKVDYIEATVSPSNQSSKKFFEKLAKEYGASLMEEEFFAAEHFGKISHEEEKLIRIGPLKERKSRKDVAI